MSELKIVCSFPSNVAYGTLAGKYVAGNGLKHVGANKLVQLFRALEGGLESASVGLESNSTDSVAASGILALSGANGMTVGAALIINGVSLTSVASSSTPQVSNGQWVLYTGSAGITTVTSLVAAINGFTGNDLVGQQVVAYVNSTVSTAGSAVSTSLTIVCKYKGYIGNAITVVMSSGTNTSTSGGLSSGRLTGGVGLTGALFSTVSGTITYNLL